MQDPEKEEEKNICVICREDLSGETEEVGCSCSGMFHAECLEMWRAINPSCPACRRDISAGD